MSYNGNDIAIKLESVSKCFQIYEKPHHRLLQGFFKGKRQYFKEFWALKDISFEIKKGETVGIIGRNGSGKSTLLQIICGTLAETSGNIEVNGRVAALLELGAGFNPEFTGRENVFMYGNILGLTREYIENKFDEIAAFADIGEFIEQPIKTYSSGMYVRLAFAVSACVEPDILIIDEALAVGDSRFQLKCINRLNILRENGSTILFVSHSMEQVKRFCIDALWIEKGKMIAQGIASHVCDKYESSNNAEQEGKNKLEKNIDVDSNQKLAKIKSVKLNRFEFSTFDPLIAIIEYDIFDKKLDSVLIGIAIRRHGDGLYIFGPNTSLDNFVIPNTKGSYVISYEIPAIPLAAGDYYIDAGIFSNKGIVCLDYKSEILKFNVKNTYNFEGILHINHNWKIHSKLTLTN